MNKSQLIDAISEDSTTSKITVGKVIESLLKVVTKTLTDKEAVNLIGFAALLPVTRAAKVGRNPKTGEAIQIAETTVVKFKAGKTLKDAVANKAATDTIKTSVVTAKKSAVKPVAKKTTTKAVVVKTKK